MHDFYLDTLGDNLQIHSSTGSIGMWIEDIEGLEMPEFRVTDYDKPGEDGGVVSSLRYGPRPIKISGIIEADTVEQFVTRKRQLLTALRIRRDSYGAPEAIRCSFEIAGETYFIDAYIVRRPVFSGLQINWCRFIIQMLAPYPFVRTITQNTSVSITPVSGGGFILPFILPVTSEERIGGQASVYNAGDAPAAVIARLYGPLTNPYINNVTAGKTMQINYVIADGDFVEIDMTLKKIMLNGSQSIISTKEDGSEWFDLEAGENLIKLSSGVTSDDGYLVLYYHDTFFGA